jgi:hypothetical protein
LPAPRSAHQPFDQRITRDASDQFYDVSAERGDAERQIWRAGALLAKNRTMASAIGVLREQWATSCERLLRRLEGLTDEEYRWEPIAGCWNVRPDAKSPSGWTVDYPDVPPDPPPVTSIAWRLLHVSDGNTIYWEHAFGPQVRNFWDLAPHGDADGAIDYLVESQRPVTETLRLFDDVALDEMRPTHFGVEWPARRVLAVLIDEQVHHGAEVGLLRDLYRHRT